MSVRYSNKIYIRSAAASARGQLQLKGSASGRGRRRVLHAIAVTAPEFTSLCWTPYCSRTEHSMSLYVYIISDGSRTHLTNPFLCGLALTKFALSADSQSLTLEGYGVFCNVFSA